MTPKVQQTSTNSRHNRRAIVTQYYQFILNLVLNFGVNEKQVLMFDIYQTVCGNWVKN